MATETWILDGVKELDDKERVIFFIQYEREKRSVSTGVLIAMLLGFTGIQKFYLEDVGLEFYHVYLRSHLFHLFLPY